MAKVNSVVKNRRIEVLKDWINTLSAFDEFSRVKVLKYNGDELDKMTLKEINMVIDYVTAVYHMAYQKGRKDQKENT